MTSDDTVEQGGKQGDGTLCGGLDNPPGHLVFMANIVSSPAAGTAPIAEAGVQHAQEGMKAGKGRQGGGWIAVQQILFHGDRRTQSGHGIDRRRRKTAPAAEIEHLHQPAMRLVMERIEDK